MGDEALEKGLVDRLGGMETAIALGKEKAKLGADEAVKLELFTHKKTVLEALLDKDDEGDSSIERASAALVQKVLAGSVAGPLLKKVPYLGVFTSQVMAGERVFPMMDVAIDPR
jgi:ClpP class serine protease